MLRDVYWRQYPVDLLSDDKMACVEAMLPDDQKHIPYMIYIAALKLCDDNGVFDFDDGVVLARLTRVKDVSLVKDVVNLMRQRKILYRLFDNSTLCGLTDWTYADKKSRTIEERRKLVAERIQKEQVRAGVDKDFTLPGEQAAPMQTAPAAVMQGTMTPELQARIERCKKCESYDAAENICTTYYKQGCNYIPRNQEAETAPAADSSLCTENDKKAENVVISRMDDKNAKNVVTLQYNTVHDNTLHNTEQTDIQTNTHTQQQLPSYGQLESPPPGNCQNNADVAAEIQNINTDTPNIPTTDESAGGEDISTLAEMAWQETRKGVENKDTGELVTYLNDFFVKNCYGFKPKQSVAAINKLVDEILLLSDDVNPPETVASVMCSEFKKMCEGQREKYWNRMPLLPANMIKPRAWAELVQYAGKILATSQNQDKFFIAAERARNECEAEKELVGDAMRQEYLKYNISPDDPQAQKLLLMAKSREQEAARKAKEDTEDTLPAGTDIF